MDKQDKSSLEEEISRMVESALENWDFKKLSQSIENTVNKALDQVGQNVSQAGKIIQEKVQKEKNGWTGPDTGGQQRTANMGNTAGGAAGQDRQAGTQNISQTWRNLKSPAAIRRQLQRERYTKNGGMTGQAVFMMVSGILLLAYFGSHLIATAVSAALAGSFGLAEGIWLGAHGILTAAGGALTGIGARLLGYANRFKRYVAQLDGREFCDIEELSHITGKSRKYVLKDVRRMIRDKLFKQGHLDSQGTCLMVTDQAYDQYQAALQSLKQRQQEAEFKEKQQESWDNPHLSQEARKVIRDGKQYLEQIKKCNESIPGEEISRKISRMELVIDKIFARVEQHPELVDDLRKFMDYYLPTTVKLLKAYEEMDAQPVQGTNIVNSKKEIEDTLDIINQAFENLLDSFFEDTAWDISTDISVFKTMLAQEGLTGSEFEQNRKK